MSDKSKHELYVCELKAHVVRYLSILESIFGPRDPRFKFGTIQKSDDGSPCTYFPDDFHFDGDCCVNIRITDWLWTNCSPDQGPWQVAHECVHLLDPGQWGSANVLEEGLATWFQDEPIYHNEQVQRYIDKKKSSLNGGHTLAYLEARDLVRSSLPDILNAVKTLRVSKKIRIRDISADVLAPLLPNTEEKKIERLCARFQN